MKRFVITFCFFLLLFQGFGQGFQRKISGRVTGTNGEPVEFANIYINNTSSHCLSDTSGRFELKIPAQLTDFELVVSRIGFQEKRQQYKGINKNLVLNIRLQDDKTLKEVMVKAKQDPMWKKKWATFKKGLLGESMFADNCVIENPEDVELQLDGKKIILATTRAPIRISNHGLGYSIIISIQAFKTDGYATYSVDSKYFIPLTPKDEREAKRWEKNRLIAYKNSFRHFLVSMIKNPDDEKFEIYYQPEVRESYPTRLVVSQEIRAKKLFHTDTHAFVRVNSDSTEFYFASRVPLLIFLKDRYNKNSPYIDTPYEFSQVVLPNRYMAFNKYGWINRPNGLFLHNYWGKEGAADLLPYDYYPDAKMQETETSVEQTSIVLEEIENKTFRRDSSALYMASGISYVRPISNLPETAREDAEIADMLYKSDYDVSAMSLQNANSIVPLLQCIPGLKIETNGITVSAISFRENGNIAAFSRASGNGSNENPCLILNGQVICDKDMVLLSLDTIDVKTIKKMGVMRYGSNASLGARGANGAIVINTRK